MSKVKIENIVKEKLNNFEFEYDNSWEKFEQKLPKRKINYTKYYLGAVAAIAAIATLIILLTPENKNNIPEINNVKQQVSESGTQKSFENKTQTTQKPANKPLLSKNENKQKSENRNSNPTQPHKNEPVAEKQENTTKPQIKQEQTKIEKQQENNKQNEKQTTEITEKQNNDKPVIPEIDFTTSATKACAPAKITFSVTKLLDNLTYKWFVNNKQVSSNSKCTLNFDKAGIFDVELKVFNKSGKLIQDIEKQKLLTINSTPDNEFSIENDDNIYLIDGPDNCSTKWFVNGKQVSNENDPELEIKQIGKINIQLIAENENHCKSSNIKTIKIEPVFQIPNAFTPDMNGNNETFGPVFENLDNIKYFLYIYNIKGNLIFKSNYANEDWNGTINNSSQMATEGKYIWQLQITDNFGHIITKKGQLTLKR